MKKAMSLLLISAIAMQTVSAFASADRVDEAMDRADVNTVVAEKIRQLDEAKKNLSQLKAELAKAEAVKNSQLPQGTVAIKKYLFGATLGSMAFVASSVVAGPLTMKGIQRGYIGANVVSIPVATKWPNAAVVGSGATLLSMLAYMITDRAEIYLTRDEVAVLNEKIDLAQLEIEGILAAMNNFLIKK